MNVERPATEYSRDQRPYLSCYLPSIQSVHGAQSHCNNLNLSLRNLLLELRSTEGLKVAVAADELLVYPRQLMNPEKSSTH